MTDGSRFKGLRGWIWAAIAALVLFGLVQWKGGKERRAQSNAESLTSTQPQTESAPDSEGPAAPDASAPSSSSEEPTADEGKISDAPRLEFPTLEKVREEVKANPHATPPSLVQFARDLAPQMEEALKAEEPKVVKRMAFALKACALSDSRNALPQVQALCISNWKRLVEAREKDVAGLRDELKRSESRFPAEAQRLIDASNAMLKPAGEE